MNNLELTISDKGLGDGKKTADIVVSAYNANDTSIFSNEDSGWLVPQSIIAVSSGKITIKVKGKSTSDSGTYGIVYTARP
jgi:hypothetical protein